MNVYNQDKTQILTEYDLTKGFLANDKILVKTIPEKQAIYTYTNWVTLPNGGKIRDEILVSPYKPQQDVYEDIKVYIPYEQEYLNEKELAELEQWFVYYDRQVAEYNRCTRLGIEYTNADGLTMQQLDQLAEEKKARINELRGILGV